VQIMIRAVAQAIDVPLWVEKPNIDLLICTYDRLYQDSIVIHNRFLTFANIDAASTCLSPTVLFLPRKLCICLGLSVRHSVNGITEKNHE